MIYKGVRSGYILMLTMMIISLSVILITYIAYKGSAYIPFARATIEREKATMFALSGVQIAMAQLGGQKPKEEEEKNKKQAEDPHQKDALQLLKTILPHKNQWQTFSFKKSRDGITGSIAFCIMSEQGKIDINALYDFQKHDFSGDKVEKEATKKMVQMLFERIKTFMGGENLFAAFEKFLKERQYKLRDVTELLTIKEFESFKRSVFYEPPEKKGESENKEKRPLYLTDIFTVWSGSKTLDPWLLSDSVAGILDLKRADGDEHKDQVVEILKKFKAELMWPADWNTLFAPLYGKKFENLPKGIEHMLHTTFASTTFSVLSYGKIGKVTQKMLAIIERTVSESQDNKIEVAVVLKKLYWL